MEINYLKAGDTLYKKHGVSEILEITDNDIIYSGGRIYNINHVRKIKGSLIYFKTRELANEIEKYEKEYPYIITDAWNNLAVSKINKTDFQELSKKGNYSDFYNENVKLLSHSLEYKEKDLQVEGIPMHPIINDYISLLNMFAWDIITCHNMIVILDSMHLLGGKYTEDDYYIYENTEFIKGKI